MAQNKGTDLHTRKILSIDEVFERAPGIVAIMRDYAREHTEGNTEIFQFGAASYFNVFNYVHSNAYNKIKRAFGLRKPSIPRASHSTLVLAETKEGRFDGVKPYWNKQIFLKPLIMAEDYEEYGGSEGWGLHIVCNPNLDVSKVEEIASRYKPKVNGLKWSISHPTLDTPSDWDNWYATPAKGIKRS